MKKTIALILIGLITALSFVGCGTNEETSSNAEASNQSVTTTSVATATSTTTSKKSSSSKATTSKKPVKSSKVETAKASSEEERKYTEREKVYYGLDPEMYSIGLKNEGNSARIAALMKKAEKGGSYKIAVLGGSISEGSLATIKELSYGYLVCEWWKETFPNADFEFVNAGLGATTPEMACYRLETDLLSYKPDFVVVDFAVNEDNDMYNTYSALLYRILSQKNSPAVMSIDFTRCADREKCEKYSVYEKDKSIPNKGMTQAVEEYDIPAMSYHNYIWTKMGKGVIRWEDVNGDYIHPKDNGHRTAASLIICYLKKVMEKLPASPKITAPKKPQSSAYLNLKYLTNTTSGVSVKGGFTANSNAAPRYRGWNYTFTSAASTLVVPVPANKSVKIFMCFDSNAKGKITVTDSKGNSQVIVQSDAKNPTLVDVGSMSGKITLTANMETGGFSIYGIGLEI